VSQPEQPLRRPLNPYLVLLAAILLPGFGHVLNGQARRGLTMQLFMIVFAFVTWHLAPPAASLIGKLSGGLFVYALSLPEAYRTAKFREVVFNRGDRPKSLGEGGAAQSR
jgi:hypothetical protein